MYSMGLDDAGQLDGLELEGVTCLQAGMKDRCVDTTTLR